jgi:hypothetical protein
MLYNTYFNSSGESSRELDVEGKEHKGTASTETCYVVIIEIMAKVNASLCLIN